MHLILAKNFFLLSKPNETQHFVLDQYIKTVFQGNILDIGTARVSIAGKSQFKAL